MVGPWIASLSLFLSMSTILFSLSWFHLQLLRPGAWKSEAQGIYCGTIIMLSSVNLF